MKPRENPIQRRARLVRGVLEAAKDLALLDPPLHELMDDLDPVVAAKILLLIRRVQALMREGDRP